MIDGMSCVQGGWVWKLKPCQNVNVEPTSWGCALREQIYRNETSCTAPVLGTLTVQAPVQISLFHVLWGAGVCRHFPFHFLNHR